MAGPSTGTMKNQNVRLLWATKTEPVKAVITTISATNICASGCVAGGYSGPNSAPQPRPLTQAPKATAHSQRYMVSLGRSTRRNRCQMPARNASTESM